MFTSINSEFNTNFDSIQASGSKITKGKLHNINKYIYYT